MFIKYRRVGTLSRSSCVRTRPATTAICLATQSYNTNHQQTNHFQFASPSNIVPNRNVSTTHDSWQSPVQKYQSDFEYCKNTPNNKQLCETKDNVKKFSLNHRLIQSKNTSNNSSHLTTLGLISKRYRNYIVPREFETRDRLDLHGLNHRKRKTEVLNTGV